MTKVAVTGATGLVGSRILELLSQDFEFLSISQKDVDIANKTQVNECLDRLEFDLLLHLAGYTKVDAAERERELAHRINVEGTQNIFEKTKEKRKPFIYISTDFVFDGTNPPYFEDSLPHPIGYYGQTKYEGEEVVKDDAMILRISYPYRASFLHKKDFVAAIRTLLEQRKEVKMIQDALFTPTFIDDIAMGLKHLINNFAPEIFHIVGADSLSPFEAGTLIAKEFNLDASFITPTTYDEFYGENKIRPRKSIIKSKKNTFFKMSTFEEGLRRVKMQSQT